MVLVKANEDSEKGVMPDERLKRAPFAEAEVEIRQVFETEEFAASDPTGKIREQEHRLREQAARNAKR